MLLRSTVLALALVVGTAAAAPAQSDEYPFRRFRMHATPHLRFSFDNSFGLKSGLELRKKLAVERSWALMERARDRKWDREFALQNRRFEMQDRAHDRALDLQLRGMDRLKERLDHFRFERPLRIKRHSRII